MARLIHSSQQAPAETTTREVREVALVPADEFDGARAELLREAVAEVAQRARRYVQEPADAAWHDLLAALTSTYGDSDTYDLLRAVEIHTRIGMRR